MGAEISMKREVYECDSCGGIIMQERDVYRIELRGARWMEPDVAGGPSEIMQNVKKLGFCEKCARRIVETLEKIAKREA